jgi:hypothetical protein
MNILELAQDAGLLVVLDGSGVYRIPKCSWDIRRISALCTRVGVGTSERASVHGALGTGAVYSQNVAIGSVIHRCMPVNHYGAAVAKDVMAQPGRRARVGRRMWPISESKAHEIASQIHSRRNCGRDNFASTDVTESRLSDDSCDPPDHHRMCEHRQHRTSKRTR